MNIHFCDTFLKGQHTFPSCGRNECCYFDRNNMFLTCSSFWQQLKKQHGSCGISCYGGLRLVGEAPWTMVEITAISFFIFKKKNNWEEQKSFKEWGHSFPSCHGMWPPGWWEQSHVLGGSRQGGRHPAPTGESPGGKLWCALGQKTASKRDVVPPVCPQKKPLDCHLISIK